MYEIFNMEDPRVRTLSVNEYKGLSLAVEARRSPRERALAEAQEWESLERAFWSSLMSAQPLYGSDSPGTLFDSGVSEWNVANLPSLLHVAGVAMPGISLPMLYFGQWRAMFAWHKEDCDLASINYMHFGAPKQWYGIPPRYAAKFEQVMQGIFAQRHQQCREFLRHKQYIVRNKRARTCKFARAR